MANEDVGQGSIVKALDVAKPLWYHVTAIVVSGMGFFTDSYDLFVISFITKLLGRIYFQVPGSSSPGSLPASINAAVSGVAFAGTLLGQIFFGCLGDMLGRKRVYGMILLIMTVCSICSGLSFGKDPKSVMITLCFFRFWLGFGIGGDYTVSTTIMSEYANKRIRGMFIAEVFVMQQVGILAAGTFSSLVSFLFEMKYPSRAFMLDGAASTVPKADYVWRIILMVGAIPALLTYYLRMKMSETALAAKNVKQPASRSWRLELCNELFPTSSSDMAKVLHVDIEASSAKQDQARVSSDEFGLFSTKFLLRHGLHLFGTATTWFLLDITFYSQNFFQKDIFTALGKLPPAKAMNAFQEVYIIARDQTIFTFYNMVPGYCFTMVFMDDLGRRKIQIMGFAMMTAFMLALAIPYHHWTLPHYRFNFVFLYFWTFFFSNFGPNATTFIIPAEIFPTRLRSTCHGISAGSGKAGAMVGLFGFDALVTALGMSKTLYIMAGINAVGLTITFLTIPEPKGISLEELTGEEEIGFVST